MSSAARRPPRTSTPAQSCSRSNLLGTRFGSYERALLAAGLVPARRTWTREAVIDALTRFQREHGRWPTSADLRSTRGTGYPPATAVRAIFGDLHSAQRACGYTGPPQRTRFEADDAVRALRRFHEDARAIPARASGTNSASDRARRRSSATSAPGTPRSPRQGSR